MIIGITGGIASGKSTVSKEFVAAGFPMIDADLVARQVVEPGTPGLNAVIEAFGQDFLTEEGQLNRKKLGQLVFSDEEELKKLNQLLSGIIRQEIYDQSQAYLEDPDRILVWDIPLLFEGGYEGDCDLLLVVYVDPETQLDRLIKRDQIDRESALERIQSQMSLDEKAARADIVIDNRGSLQETQAQVQALIKELKDR